MLKYFVVILVVVCVSLNLVYSTELCFNGADQREPVSLTIDFFDDKNHKGKISGPSCVVTKNVTKNYVFTKPTAVTIDLYYQMKTAYAATYSITIKEKPKPIAGVVYIQHSNSTYIISLAHPQ